MSNTRWLEELEYRQEKVGDIQAQIRELEEEIEELKDELKESDVFFENWNGEDDFAIIEGEIVKVDNVRTQDDIESDIEYNKAKIKELEETLEDLSERWC